jgi:hypothetical protein
MIDEELLENLDEVATRFDLPDFDDAIVGYTTDGRLVYSYEAMVEVLMDRDGMSVDDACEFLEYNTLRTLPYMGEFRPVILCSV